ncbi:hypothetical protein BO99DRAFT_112929 [Aspergillus violaceofuscus CBS 115571]|uniref:Uncharacterized protein n=1 Tax=Aspergillus violaceofuscus (strain CBS 115571) TaxID=1450538 RepID=A0A2V5H9K9_ASPV1|nr:hypothetical protein BO99DRAFT_112929 [Aspergillus violaceofuscus CBS 115571]
MTNRVSDSIGDFTNFDLLLEIQAPRWQVEVVWDAANGQHPHLKEMVIHDTDGKDADQRLLRAELLTLITIITARLTHKATRAYADAPVGSLPPPSFSSIPVRIQI